MKIQVNQIFPYSSWASNSGFIVDETRDKAIVLRSTAKVRALSKSEDLTLILVMNLSLLNKLLIPYGQTRWEEIWSTTKSDLALSSFSLKTSWPLQCGLYLL